MTYETSEEQQAFILGADDFWGDGKANPHPQDTAEWAAYEAGYRSQSHALDQQALAMEGSMPRKSLDDILSNDRSVSRGARYSSDDLFSGSSKGYTGSSKSWSNSHRCFTKHPPLKLPGTELVIYGGSCSDPVVLDADVYIGFDGSMRWTERHYPWKKGDEVYFRIQDMGVPQKPDEFKKLVKWTRQQLEDGRKVHCGCIGGHGRTGTFLAALVSDFGEQDAVTYVRENYCHKAVESKSQMDFLHEHFGIKKVEGSKANKSSHSKGSNKSSNVKDFGSYSSRSGSSKATAKVYGYLKGAGSIWE